MVAMDAVDEAGGVGSDGNGGGAGSRSAGSERLCVPSSEGVDGDRRADGRGCMAGCAMDERLRRYRRDAKPRPRFQTRAKMLWDDQNLYIGAELSEPNVKATLTQHDSVIFHDNDFEVFLKPPGGAPGYFEFEINALNTSWDLYLDKPYREGGKADNSWNIPGLRSSVVVRGTLNDERDTDSGWTMELAIPWRAFQSRLPVEAPRSGGVWRVNFSRVEWKTGVAKEDNWVWTPQGIVNMHVPDRWGYVHFVP